MMLRLSGEGGGEKPKATESEAKIKFRTQADDTADVRDIINALVGKGVLSLEHQDTKDDYGSLRAILGNEKAQKLMTQLFIHNQRNSTMPMEKRIQTFYDVGSNDKDVADIITATKTFGYGPRSGLYKSAKQTNQQLAGQLPMNLAAAENDDLNKKIMLRLQK